MVIPMIRKYFVQKKHFLTEEVMELAAISQSSPGAIAVNLSSLAGYKTAGLPGAVVNCIASVLPALIILSVISAWYESFSQNVLVNAVLKGMEARSSGPDRRFNSRYGSGNQKREKPPFNSDGPGCLCCQLFSESQCGPDPPCLLLYLRR